MHSRVVCENFLAIYPGMIYDDLALYNDVFFYPSWHIFALKIVI